MREASFKDYVLDQLSLLPDVRARAMFGAHGLYQGEHFFAIVDEGRLFFKADSSTQADYLACGMAPFTYEARGKIVTLGFYEVPPDILEQPPELAIWAQKAVAVARVKIKKAVKRRPS